ncbi:unnamed protein product, partial [Lymnaea stagnalis]
PVDVHSKIYLAFVLSGIGYMLPYTCFIVAVDYYQVSYSPSPGMPSGPAALAFVSCLMAIRISSLVGVLQALSAGLISGWLLGSGLFRSSSIGSFHLLLCCSSFGMFLPSLSFTDFNFMRLSFPKFTVSVQQSSFYGYANMLPRRYTQAVMVGESLAGVLVSFNRIVTKLLLEDEKVNTIIFFIISLVVIVVCCVTFFLARWTSFVQHHLRSCRGDGKTRGHGDVSIIWNTVLFIKYINSEGRETWGDDSNIVCSEKPREVIDVSRQMSLRGRDSVIDHQLRHCDVGNRLTARWDVIKQIYPYMASFALTFYVSVSLYPGIVSEVVSCRLGTWMPVILMACFNVTDAFGKMLTALRQNYSKLRLLLCSLARICLIPLVVLCIKPRLRPTLSGEAWSIFITILLGVTNGYFGSLPLVLAPSQVAPRLRELCG